MPAYEARICAAGPTQSYITVFGQFQAILCSGAGSGAFEPSQFDSQTRNVTVPNIDSRLPIGGTEPDRVLLSHSLESTRRLERTRDPSESLPAASYGRPSHRPYIYPLESTIFIPLIDRTLARRYHFALPFRHKAAITFL